jgi:lipopolysaccharide/colanic/teichoic acid biosynthesis glycosyltransferase
MTPGQAVAKRTVDVTASTLGLALLLPFMAIIALAIKLDSPGPVLYNSRRLGWHGKEFRLYKFRTMHEGAPPRYLPDGSLLVEKTDSRITRVGRVLRLGFDELPQLWNVLRGDMSLIGPRPDMPYALDLYQGEEALRLTVRPGITGLAQVNGRTDIAWRARLEYDVVYVKHYSFGMDLRVAALTLAEFVPPLRRALLQDQIVKHQEKSQ